MKVNFETERLIIRPLVPDDAKAAFRWCGDPNVNTYMIYPLYHRAEDVRTWLESRDADDPDNYDEGIIPFTDYCKEQNCELCLSVL